MGVRLWNGVFAAFGSQRRWVGEDVVVVNVFVGSAVEVDGAMVSMLVDIEVCGSCSLALSIIRYAW